jgi:hypothetical protein
MGPFGIVLSILIMCGTGSIPIRLAVAASSGWHLNCRTRGLSDVLQRQKAPEVPVAVPRAFHGHRFFLDHYDTASLARFLSRAVDEKWGDRRPMAATLVSFGVTTGKNNNAR